MATYSIDQKLNLLNLPLEIRLEVYRAIFRTEPIRYTVGGRWRECNCGYSSGEYEDNNEVWVPYMPHHMFTNTREKDLTGSKIHYHRGIIARSWGLFTICKQILFEAFSVFEAESPLDLYSWRSSPIHVKRLVGKTKHIICGVDQVRAWWDDNFELDRLERVTIIDDSKFFEFLTNTGEDWRDQNLAKWRTSSGLKGAIAVLSAKGIKMIAIRSAKLVFQRREILLCYGKEGVQVYVRGIYCWDERVQKAVLNLLDVDPKMTKFEFEKWNCRRIGKGVHAHAIDYLCNSRDRTVERVNRTLQKVNQPFRVSVQGGRYTLLGRTFSAAVFAKLCKVVVRKSELCHQILSKKPRLEKQWHTAKGNKILLIKLLSQPESWQYPCLDKWWMTDLIRTLKEEATIPNLDTIEQERIFSARSLKMALYYLMSDREKHDSNIAMCEFLTMAQSSPKQVPEGKSCWMCNSSPCYTWCWKFKADRDE